MMCKTKGHTMKKYLPILVIAAAAVAGAVFLQDYISFDVLRDNRQALLKYRDSHFVLTALGFVVGYFLIVAFSLPGAAVASITGGFLFGLGVGTVLNVVAATLGASAIFWAVQFGFGSKLADQLSKSDGRAAQVMAGLRNNAVSVLLMLRLVPVVPFFVANVLPALVGIRFFQFFWTTALGIIPGGLVFTWIGVGIGDVFDRGGTPDLSLIWSPHILGPLLGLAALAALSMIFNNKER